MNTIASLFGYLFGFGAPGPVELAIIAGIILLLFGSSKLPTLMRNLGRSTNEFKKGMSESSTDEDASAKAAPPAGE